MGCHTSPHLHSPIVSYEIRVLKKGDKKSHRTIRCNDAIQYVPTISATTDHIEVPMRLLVTCSSSVSLCSRPMATKSASTAVYLNFQQPRAWEPDEVADVNLLLCI